MTSHRGFLLLAFSLALVVSRDALATPSSWEGTLALRPFGPLPSVAITGSGVATVTSTTGGFGLESVRFASGLTGVASAPVTDPEVTGSIDAVLVAVQLGSGTLGPFQPTAPLSEPQLTERHLPVRGIARVCVLLSGCVAGPIVALTASNGQVGVGVGGLVGGTSISLEGAPWTLRTTGISFETSAGSSASASAFGWLHGAFSFTGSTAFPGGAFQVVTPLRVTGSGSFPSLSAFGELTIRFVPEPAQGLLLFAGALALLLARPRKKRPGEES